MPTWQNRFYEEAGNRTGMDEGFADFYSYWSNFYFSELVVAPILRGKGHGTAILREVLGNGEAILGQPIAVIFPSNIASQKSFDHAHSDGDAWYYTYEASNTEKEGN